MVRAGVLVPRGAIAQSRFKDAVCLGYAAGQPIKEVVEHAAFLEREKDPTFEPDYDPRLLALL
jgi:hypothetical protein